MGERSESSSCASGGWSGSYRGVTARPAAGHAGGATAASGRTARATRPDALGLAAAVAETDARPAQQVPAGVEGCSGWGCGVKKSLHAQEQDTEEGQRRRQAWREQVSQIDRERLVFLDESGVTTQLTRRYGRAPRGERVQPAQWGCGYVYGFRVTADCGFAVR